MKSRQARLLVVIGGFLSALTVISVVANLAGRLSESPPTRAPSTGTVGRVQTSAVVVNTEGIGVFLRRSPVLGERLDQGIPEGSQVTVVSEETVVDGSAWRQVEDASGGRGWVPAQYIRLLGPPPS